MPERIQLKRIKGWRMPPNTVKVTRPGRYGNPFVVGRDGTVEECIAKFKAEMPDFAKQAYRNELRGKNLACFCPLDRPCHADYLLEISND